jgi:hypothetical protein
MAYPMALTDGRFAFGFRHAKIIRFYSSIHRAALAKNTRSDIGKNKDPDAQKEKAIHRARTVFTFFKYCYFPNTFFTSLSYAKLYRRGWMDICEKEIGR